MFFVRVQRMLLPPVVHLWSTEASLSLSVAVAVPGSYTGSSDGTACGPGGGCTTLEPSEVCPQNQVQCENGCWEGGSASSLGAAWDEPAQSSLQLSSKQRVSGEKSLLAHLEQLQVSHRKLLDSHGLQVRVRERTGERDGIRSPQVSQAPICK